MKAKVSNKNLASRFWSFRIWTPYKILNKNSKFRVGDFYIPEMNHFCVYLFFQTNKCFEPFTAHETCKDFETLIGFKKKHTINTIICYTGFRSEKIVLLPILTLFSNTFEVIFS